MSKIAVVYWSGTGNTEAMADLVANAAQSAGATVDKMTSAEFNAADAANYDGFALGCPAMGAEQLGGERVRADVSGSARLPCPASRSACSAATAGATASGSALGLRMLRLPAPGWWLTPLWPTAHPMAMPLMPATPWALPWPTPDTQSSRGNTAQFPPDGLSTAPAAAAHRLRCKNARECRVAVPASCFGDKSPSHSATAAPCFGSLYPPPAAPHLCSTKYYLRFLLSSRRTSLAVSALKIARYCLKFKFSNHCLSPEH